MATEQITKLRSETAYAPLVHDLRDAIASGRLGLGDRISGEVALSKDYGISVTSVRSGIKALVNDGLLRRKRGSGTYVTGGKVTAPAAAARSVRCDTIAVGSIVNAVTYHPYYTERLAGFRAGLV